MSRVFIIPDVHLKPWMFDEADKLIRQGIFDEVVMLGDLVDDWGQEHNRTLYNETFDTVIDFVDKHPNTRLCYGNHDVSYLWEKEESGYSYFMRDLVVDRMKELEGLFRPGMTAFVHRIDDVVFSHGGVTESFVIRHFGDAYIDLDILLDSINKMSPDELWEEDSPLWARPWPIRGDMLTYLGIRFQVVGHTPLYHKELKTEILIADTFSTFSDGQPMGDGVFLCIDTKTLNVEELNEAKHGKTGRGLW